MIFQRGFMANMSKQKQAAITATMLLVFMASLFASYVIESIQLMSYAEKFDIQNTAEFRSSHIHDAMGFVALHKYFVFSAIFGIGSIRAFFVPGLKPLSILTFILAVWLTISAMQEFYGFFDFPTVTASGIALQLIAVGIYLFLLFQWKSDSRAVP